VEVLSVPQVLDAKRDMEDCQLLALSRKMQFQLLKLSFKLLALSL
jgi:hypothetical protein